MQNSFNKILESTNAKSIVILLPTNPYFDQVAAGLSLYLSLKDKFDVSIASPSPMLVEFNRLVSVDKIKTELGNKNLIIKFSNYDAENIDRVSFDVEGKVAYLKVIPKPSFAPPKKEQIEAQYSGVLADLAILIGGGSEIHFPAINTKDFLDVKLVHVGIRELRLNEGREVISFARQASSISELVANLIKENELKLNEDISSNLLMGIEEGTRNFTGIDVTADTFLTFGQLMKAGGKRMQKVSERERKSFPPGSIPGEPPKPQSPQAPKSWYEPKIFKGTSVS
ncbi:MAG: hypothetical protein HY044_01535 [Candidatus Woesebacteria bacterium]|nr:MAG: hypothetical protein HY044_01535 [Candidatus Woesebacteria bacterium]